MYAAVLLSYPHWRPNALVCFTKGVANKGKQAKEANLPVLLVGADAPVALSHTVRVQRGRSADTAVTTWEKGTTGLLEHHHTGREAAFLQPGAWPGPTPSKAIRESRTPEMTRRPLIQLASQ